MLRVDPNGGRAWPQRITIRDKRRKIGVDTPPAVKLAEARARAEENKRLARASGDPIAATCKENAALTLAEAAKEHLAGNTAEVLNERLATQ